MTIEFTSPITGGAQTGLTSPTYTVVPDLSVGNPRTKGIAVTALGGTQTGVRTSTISDPFKMAYTPPAGLKSLPQANSVTGRYGQIPYNWHNITLEKGVNYAASQSPLPMKIECRIGIPAGADSYDSVNVRAGTSLFEGAIAAFAAGLGDTLVTGNP